MNNNVISAKAEANDDHDKIHRTGMVCQQRNSGASQSCCLTVPFTQNKRTFYSGLVDQTLNKKTNKILMNNKK